MLQWIAKKWLDLLGWKTTFTQPPTEHGIYIVYPHTSNWDFLYGILWKFAVGAQPRWVAKDTLFRPPLGWLMRKLGGIGIKRSGNLDVTTSLKNAMLNEQNCWLCIAIEGTRKHKPYIHMGYYHIARAANVPLGIAIIDYATKTAGVSTYRMAKDSVEEELAQLALDFKDVGARFPEKAGDLKVREHH